MLRDIGDAIGRKLTTVRTFMATRWVVLVLVLLTASCSGSQSQLGDADPRSVLLDDMSQLSAAELEAVSPISERFGVVARGLDESALHIAREEAIAICMRGRGFDYVIVPLPAIAGPVELVPQFAGQPGDVDWARENGFGISGLFAGGPSGAPSPSSVSSPDRTNFQLFGLLSAPEQDKWLEALYGPAGEKSPEVIASLPSVSVLPARHSEALRSGSGGCLGDASVAVSGVATLPDGFSEQAGEIGDLVLDHADYATAVDSWRSCVSQAGHDYDSPSEMRNHLFEEVMGASLSGSAQSGAALAELERELAVLNIECDPGIDRVANELRIQYETLLVGSFEPAD